MTRLFHIACLQTRPQATMALAVDEVMPMMEEAAAAGAQMVFLPEYCGGLQSDGVRLIPPSEPEELHPVLAALQAAAERLGIWVNIGSIAVDGPAGQVINRGYTLDNNGVVRARYDKIHLFDVALSPEQVYRESDTVLPGDQACLLETPWARLGHTICYDLRFAQLYRQLAQAGAEILCCPAAFTRQTGQAHWHVLNRARAIENGAFVVSACALGAIPGGGESYGHSLIVDPWGAVLADGGTTPGVVAAEIDLDAVARTRARIPSLTHDRPYRLETVPEPVS